MTGNELKMHPTKKENSFFKIFPAVILKTEQNKIVLILLQHWTVQLRLLVCIPALPRALVKWVEKQSSLMHSSWLADTWSCSSTPSSCSATSTWSMSDSTSPSPVSSALGWEWSYPWVSVLYWDSHTLPCMVSFPSFALVSMNNIFIEKTEPLLQVLVLMTCLWLCLLTTMSSRLGEIMPVYPLERKLVSQWSMQESGDLNNKKFWKIENMIFFSVTVTSFTDVFAFGVGAITVSIFFKMKSCYILFVSENARITIFLCVYSHSSGLYLYSPSVLVRCLAGSGWEENLVQEKWSHSMHLSQR